MGEAADHRLVPNCIGKELVFSFGLENPHRQNALGGSLNTVEGEVGQLDQAKEKIRQESLPISGLAHGGGKESGKVFLKFPMVLILCNNDGDDGEERTISLLQLHFPNADHVAEKPKGNPWIVIPLMFKEEVEGNVPLVGVSAEE